jgi:hypothetical protein
MALTKPQEYRDDWGTSAREGYEDRGRFRQPRAPQKEPGSAMLRTIGMICIVAGLFWGTYDVTKDGNIIGALEQNHGPIAVVGLGVVVSILGKYLRI